jgi:hypothetical protein
MCEAGVNLYYIVYLHNAQCTTRSDSLHLSCNLVEGLRAGVGRYPAKFKHYLIQLIIATVQRHTEALTLTYHQ